MKTLQELFDEIMGSDELKRAFVEALKATSVEDFLKQNGCDATVEELAEFLEAKAASEDAPMELSEDVLAAVAGGTGMTIDDQPGTSNCSDDCTEIKVLCC